MANSDVTDATPDLATSGKLISKLSKEAYGLANTKMVHFLTHRGSLGHISKVVSQHNSP